jgi:asparagine synthase (glutamine-hydrolysing)
MCGIFGIYYSDPKKQISTETIRSAIDQMKHRGPDDSGIFQNKNVGLGHRRLSIIDLSSGHQPMFNEDNSIALVYNGEIYNFKEIKDQLVQKGHDFKTNCDTEVIIHAYEEWGTDSVKLFNGMFAFILWDSTKNRLWVVRDRLGIKPVYYYWDGATFVCASEVKPILNTGVIASNINHQVLDAYCTLGYVPGPDTMFQDIYKLLPGCFFLVENGQLREIEYWDFCSTEEIDIPFDDAKDKIEFLLKDSIQKRLMSDVPLGVFLSGGIDSSAVVALMCEENLSKIKTFTVSYDKKLKVGEEAYAAMIANKFHTDHHVFELSSGEFFESLDTLVSFAEEPIVESAGISLYHISQMARSYATVLLSGEGSDEVFAGYFLYDFFCKINSIRKYTPSFLFRPLKTISNLSGNIKLNKYMNWLESPPEQSYMGTSNYLNNNIKEQFYSREFYKTKGNYLEDTFLRYFSKVKNKKGLLNKLLYVDTKTWLVDDLLIKADKMTMATSVELRVPFLDYRLVEFAASLPDNYKISNSQRKYILKTILKDRLPTEILQRKKMGFPVPTQNWFKTDLFDTVRDKILNDQHFKILFNYPFLEKLLSEHKSGKRDHGKLLMMLLVLWAWKRKFLN